MRSTSPRRSALRLGLADHLEPCLTALPPQPPQPPAAYRTYFSKVMKVETAHAKALFRVADATRDGFLEYREFLGLMAILYRHLL